MARGEYGPIAPRDLDTQLVVGWTEQKALNFARDRAYDVAAQPFMTFVPTIDKAVRMRKAIRWMRVGSTIGGRAEGDKGLTQIGGELFHSIADRQRAVSRLSSEFQSLVNDIAVWHAANEQSSNATAIAQWIAADVTPTLTEWHEFVACEDKSWWTKAATKWETFEDWQDRLRRLRGLARAHGITLESPEPVDLPKTVWERGAEGKGGEAAALLGVLKVAVAAALGVTGFVTMYAVVRELKAPRVIEAVVPKP
jgi:hypothetical protein